MEELCILGEIRANHPHQQIPFDKWHAVIGDPTPAFAGAGSIHNAYRTTD
ncbi:MAG: hypothetical protein JO139_09390 [Alphaproteobacteria bacterium]|nr:hypothetical protein [Alphaproteobacteria bacterium]